jgi:hypothetical protein
MKKKLTGILPLALLALAPWACGDEERQGRSLDLECLAAFEARGQDLLDEHAACESDADCAIIASAPGCISPFLCSVAVTAGRERDFVDAAGALIDEYTGTCGPFCSIADCTSPEGLRPACDVQTGLCSFEQVERSDAVDRR